KMFTTLFVACLLVSSLAGESESTGSIGACISGACPPGFQCVSNECVAVTRRKRSLCPKEQIIGECIAGICPTGFRCDGVNC
ncbi:hypothetical protein PENTCL1PPCAC_24908, partial [Pristionchus entomophagus]